MTLRTGLVGTGTWARMAHGPALSAVPGTRPAAVWGRDPAAARDLATAVGDAAGESVVAVADFDAFLDEVDLVAFAVPPDVQGALALRAARAGKHLVLDKPVALTADAGRELLAAAEASGLATAVFFTHQFFDDYVAWSAAQAATTDWRGARIEGLSSYLSDASGAFYASPWRHERGAWWDAGPHVVAQLVAVLGPVAAVCADRGPGDITDVLVWHESGVRSTICVGFDLPAGTPNSAWFLGENGKVEPPPFPGDFVGALRSAIGSVVATAERGAAPTRFDLRFGQHVLEVLEAADRSIRLGGRVEVPTS